MRQITSFAVILASLAAAEASVWGMPSIINAIRGGAADGNKI
eukprot:CAMPEP_0202459726 /NCGR_PEP_ID=MMETSP1360-20130828/38012_1 /ASSEMBLY_ACC=CAM_ASM_000848 /TAXON_ID=515479 /ORGANISM="Licmophora paradoxa, Strain CCMP2313" /LENGTH=41 /DNA_ID= /DNA_START= /DNA_END= /DNA_ORIENTATION=